MNQPCALDSGVERRDLDRYDFSGRKRSWRGALTRRAVTFVLLVLSGFTPALMHAAVPAKANEPQRNVHPDLDLRALAEPLQDLTPAEREIVDEAIELIKQKRHALALVDLSRLIASNPMNSALRVLRAYVLLELGNVTGALDDARSAEASGLRSTYRCWFLAQVAYLAGNVPLCHREIKHIAGDPAYGPAAEKLRRNLKSGSK